MKREIPPPVVAFKDNAVRASQRIRCPDCERTWARRQVAAYELHWRIVHGTEMSGQ